MSQCWFLGLAFDRPWDSTLPPIPFAEATWLKLAGVLELHAPKRVRSVLGSAATCTVIDSKLRRLRSELRPGDELILHYTGLGYSHAGQPHLLAWDSQPDDRSGTSLDLLTLLKPLARKAKQLTLILDLLPLPDTEPLQCEALVKNIPNLTILTLSEAGEESHSVAGLNTRLGTHLITEAFSGQVPKALTAANQITAQSLYWALEDGLPRLLRRHLEGGLSQLPELFGPPDVVLADLSDLIAQRAGGLLTSERLERVCFRSESHTRVKELSDFRKGYQVPDSASPSSRKFVARMAQTDIRADLDDLLLVIRDKLPLRRKDVEVQHGSDGTGTLRTPLFEYTISATVDADDPSRVLWRRELGQFRDGQFLHSPEFQALFAARFDQLVFEFRQPVDVEELIDQLEEAPPKGLKLELGEGGQECQIRLTGHAGRIRIQRLSLIIQGRGGLLDQLMAFLKQFDSLGEPLALSGPPGKS